MRVSYDFCSYLLGANWFREWTKQERAILIWLTIHKWVEIGIDNGLITVTLDWVSVHGIACAPSFVCLHSSSGNLWPTVTLALMESPLFLQSFCVLLTPVPSVSSPLPPLPPLPPLLSSLSGIQPLMMTQGEQRREGGRKGRETLA